MPSSSSSSSSSSLDSIEEDIKENDADISNDFEIITEVDNANSKIPPNGEIINNHPSDDEKVTSNAVLSVIDSQNDKNFNKEAIQVDVHRRDHRSDESSSSSSSSEDESEISLKRVDDGDVREKTIKNNGEILTINEFKEVHAPNLVKTDLRYNTKLKDDDGSTDDIHHHLTQKESLPMQGEFAKTSSVLNPDQRNSQETVAGMREGANATTETIQKKDFRNSEFVEDNDSHRNDIRTSDSKASLVQNKSHDASNFSRDISETEKLIFQTDAEMVDNRQEVLDSDLEPTEDLHVKKEYLRRNSENLQKIGVNHNYDQREEIAKNKLHNLSLNSTDSKTDLSSSSIQTKSSSSSQQDIPKFEAQFENNFITMKDDVARDEIKKDEVRFDTNSIHEDLTDDRSLNNVQLWRSDVIETDNKQMLRCDDDVTGLTKSYLLQQEMHNEMPLPQTRMNKEAENVSIHSSNADGSIDRVQLTEHNQEDDKFAQEDLHSKPTYHAKDELKLFKIDNLQSSKQAPTNFERKLEKDVTKYTDNLSKRQNDEESENQSPEKDTAFSFIRDAVALSSRNDLDDAMPADKMKPAEESIITQNSDDVIKPVADSNLNQAEKRASKQTSLISSSSGFTSSQSSIQSGHTSSQSSKSDFERAELEEKLETKIALETSEANKKSEGIIGALETFLNISSSASSLSSFFDDDAPKKNNTIVEKSIDEIKKENEISEKLTDEQSVNGKNETKTKSTPKASVTSSKTTSSVSSISESESQQSAEKKIETALPKTENHSSNHKRMNFKGKDNKTATKANQERRNKKIGSTAEADKATASSSLSSSSQAETHDQFPIKESEFLLKKNISHKTHKSANESRKNSLILSQTTKMDSEEKKSTKPKLTLLSTKKENSLRRVKKKRDLPSSSDVTSNSSSSSSESDDAYLRHPPLRPTTAKKGGRNLQLMRPRSAKLPRTAPKTEKTETANLDKSSQIPNKKFRIPSSSNSSVANAEQDSDGFRDRKIEDVDVHEQRRIREVFLHRCLDAYLVSQLDKHRAFFERGFKSPRAGKNLKSPRRNVITSSIVSRNRNRRRSIRTRNTRDSAPILPNFTPRMREDDVKRNIQRLIAELARHESLSSFGKQSITAQRDLRSNEKEKKKKLNDEMKQKHLTDPETTFSEQASFSSENEREKKIAKKKISIKIQTENVVGESSTEESENEKNEHLLNRSILKKENSERKKKEKHVHMYEASDALNQATSSRRSVQAHKHDYYEESYSKSRLATLLRSLGPSDYIMTDNYGQMHRVTLKHCPIDRRPRRSKSRPLNRPKTKKNQPKANSDDSSVTSSNGYKYNKKIADSSKFSQRPQTAKARHGSGDEHHENLIGSSPRIRPGTAPIKCNWKPGNSEPNKTQPKFSDHQLKNSGNPAVLEWLSRKNALARRNRIYKYRENRWKRDQLMEEQNQKDDRRAHALVEYEKWKKEKNREILLRRRREALEAKANKTENLTAEQQRRNILMPNRPKESSITTFSDLRSSAVTPHPPSDPPQKGVLKVGGRRRPKSAPTKVSFKASSSDHAPQNFIPVRIDFKNGDVTVVSPRASNDITNLSAREPIMQGNGGKSSNFMRDLLGEKNPPRSMFDVPAPGTFTTKAQPQPEQNKEDKSKGLKQGFEKEHYNNWVRSKGASSPYQIKYKKKKEKKPLPPHDPLTNQLLSDLAKRRIKKILDQKKRVDSGFQRKPNPTEEEQPKSEDNSLKKWRLKDEPIVNLNLENVGKKSKQNSTKEKRPVFSYKKKTKSKSVFHERNPTVRQALYI